MRYYDYWCWNEIIPQKVCQEIISLGEGSWKQAHTYGTKKENKSLDDIRKSDVVWVTEKWVNDLIWPYMMTANEQGGWKYNIVACEDCQVTRYTEDGFYSWHKDGIGSHNEVRNEPDNEFLHGNTRKLSMTIVLNSNFEGGDFEMRGLKNKVPRLEEGSIIVFPSFLEHRVTPVTEGIRYSLVTWFMGPPFI